MLESYFNLQFTLIPYFICPQLFILFKVNCKFKVRKLVKAINISVSYCINMIIMVIQFPRVTLCICLKLFQLAISLSLPNFICPQLFILFIVQTANSKYESWWKLLMEVYQWINIDNYGHPISKCNTMFCLKVISTCNLLSLTISYVLNFSSYSK